MLMSRRLMPLALLALGAAPAFADLADFTTSGTAGGNTVSGTADFALASGNINTGGTITLTLTNTTALVNQISEVLDGLVFSFKGSLTSFSLTTVAATGFEDCTGSACTSVTTFKDYDTKAGAGCTGSSSPFTCTSPYTWTYNAPQLGAGAGSFKPGGVVNSTI